jgi:hypothetical protein
VSTGSPTPHWYSWCAGKHHTAPEAVVPTGQRRAPGSQLIPGERASRTGTGAWYAHGRDTGRACSGGRSTRAGLPRHTGGADHPGVDGAGRTWHPLRYEARVSARQERERSSTEGGEGDMTSSTMRSTGRAHGATREARHTAGQTRNAGLAAARTRTAPFHSGDRSANPTSPASATPARTIRHLILAARPNRARRRPRPRQHASG